MGKEWEERKLLRVLEERKSMKAAALSLAAALLSGCMNMYTRCPGTDAKVIETYQSTKCMASMSFVVMFPQVMMPSGCNKPMLPENLISIPIGCLFFADTACEAAVDTALWPVDELWLSKRN